MQTALQDEAELTCACAPLFPKPVETEEKERICFKSGKTEGFGVFDPCVFMFICTELFTVGLFFQRIVCALVRLSFLLFLACT